jgi:hypothetical protein
MDSYLCGDSEELYHRYDIVKQGGSGLSGIANTYRLAKANCAEDVLENIKSIEDTDWAFGGACECGHAELTLLVIHKIESYGHVVDFNWGLANSCGGGQKKLSLMMIDRGATNFDRGLSEACRNDHEELALMMISYGANANVGLIAACVSGHKKLARLMIETGATECWCGQSLNEH